MAFLFWHNKKAAFDNGGVAQGSEHSVHTRGVAGSNPATATMRRVGETVNSPAFHAGIHGFESHTRHHEKRPGKRMCIIRSWSLFLHVQAKLFEFKRSFCGFDVAHFYYHLVCNFSNLTSVYILS